MMTDFEKMRYVREHLKSPARYEGLAEECVELAHAALKLARIFRGENPTATNVMDAGEDVYEEAADVLLYLRVIELEDTNLDARQRRKLERWYYRLKEVEDEHCED